jgi:hypothetical protein
MQPWGAMRRDLEVTVRGWIRGHRGAQVGTSVARGLEVTENKVASLEPDRS